MDAPMSLKPNTRYWFYPRAGIACLTELPDGAQPPDQTCGVVVTDAAGVVPPFRPHGEAFRISPPRTLVLEVGHGRSSLALHAALRAAVQMRGRAIPLVVDGRALRAGDMRAGGTVVNATTGEVILQPSRQVRRQQARQARRKRHATV